MDDETQQMIDDCVARESRLTDWERQFIDSIASRDSLTPEQREKLDEIWDRVTERG